MPVNQKNEPQTMYTFKKWVSIEEQTKVMEVIRYAKGGLIYQESYDAHPELQTYFEPVVNEPQLSAEMEKRLKNKIAEELHIDWAFKDINAKPDAIVIRGYPKGNYETDYNLFIENMAHFLATALAEQRAKYVEQVKTMPCTYREDNLYRQDVIDLLNRKE